MSTTDKNQKHWLVELTRDVDLVPADDYNIDMSGALVFTDGDMLSRELVVAYSSGEWHKVVPYEVDDEDDEGEE